MSQPMQPGLIKPLDPSVIARIAAGEVLQRPINAIKEMLENSIDAKSTRISVILRDGGLKMIHIQDNGTGINKLDFPLVCQRFATSKISKFEDLSSIQSFGFRGEALASLSHVARVSITSMTRQIDQSSSQPQFAYRGSFSNGKMVGDLKHCAGVPGTTIVAEDLFSTMPMRRAAFGNVNAEYARCVDVLTRYAVHFSGVSISCKKHGSSINDLTTLTGASILDNIRSLYGPAVARELLPFQVIDSHYNLQVNGYVSNANYAVKNLEFSLFINDRLVNSQPIKQACTSLYDTLLPKKSHPWIYLSLKLPPSALDVNIHPTKSEVSMLHEDQIVRVIGRALSKVLLSANQSRTFVTQTLTVDRENVDVPIVADSASSARYDRERERAQPVQSTEDTESDEDVAIDTGMVDLDTISTTKKAPTKRPNRMIRTDAQQQSLSSYVTVTKSSQDSTNRSQSISDDDMTDLTQDDQPSESVNQATSQSTSQLATGQSQPVVRRRARQPTCELTSVHALIEAMEASSSASLKQILIESTFVGVVDAQHSLLQHATKLFYVNHTRLSEALFRYRVLVQFAAHPSLALSRPVSLRKMLMLAMNDEHSLAAALPCSQQWAARQRQKQALDPYSSSNNQSISQLKCHHLSVESRVQLLLSKREMLAEYFSFHVNDNCDLIGVPDLIDHHQPQLVRLPALLYQLTDSRFVDWTVEQTCFDDVANCLAWFYRIEGKPSLSMSPSPTQSTSTQPSQSHSVITDRIRGELEKSLFPAFKTGFPAPRAALFDGIVTQIASLENLYKVFERC